MTQRSLSILCVLHAGDMKWMAEGRGILHGESVEAKGKTRLLPVLHLSDHVLGSESGHRGVEPGMELIETPIRYRHDPAVK